MTNKLEAVIRLMTYEPCILTTEEYERLEKEVIADLIADPSKIGSRILGKLLLEHKSRYIECKERNKS